MSKPSRLGLAYICVLLTLIVLACSLAGPWAKSATPANAPPTADSGAGSGTSFTLTLPDATTETLQATCTGINSGGFLEINAKNTDDVTDPKRIVVQVSGAHDAVGQLNNMYILVSIGADNAWTFMGNTPSATVTLNADGSGSFSNVSIANASGTSASYNAGGEYKFSGQWKCAP